MGLIGKLNLCIEKIGGLNLDTLMDRKLLQKKIYFLQEFGVKLGYSYGFYLYGPYSSELTSDAFFLKSMKDQAPDAIEMIELSAEEERAMKEALDFFAKLSDEKYKIAYKLELLSSLHFLWNISYFMPKSKEEIFRRLKERKRIQDDSDLKEAWTYLVSNSLIKS
jgi:uncharacterized protein YwgA